MTKYEEKLKKSRSRWIKRCGGYAEDNARLRRENAALRGELDAIEIVMDSGADKDFSYEAIRAILRNRDGER